MSSSFKKYGKFDEADQERLIAHRKTRKRITIIVFSSVVLVCVVAAIVFGVSQTNANKFHEKQQSISSTVNAICDVTLYPDSCYNSIAPLVKNGKIQPEDIYKLSVQVAINELSTASSKFLDTGAFRSISTNKTAFAALESCNELLSMAKAHLNDSLSTSVDFQILDAFDDLRTWLSSAQTYLQTCIDGFDNDALSNMVFLNLKNSSEYTSNSLAIITSIANSLDSLVNSIGGRRRLMKSSFTFTADDEAPNWLSSKDRKLLQANSSNIDADAIVATDGTGNYSTIGAALKDVPDHSKKRFVIYVKKGVYVENVRVEISKWNVMMIGDGMNATIVSGNLNFVDGTPTFQTATFAVFGQKFIARDMGFRNTAGATKQQAVALMSSADQSVFFRCRIEAFQDTLYSHSNRQFYRECNIYGTVDFIFGNSAVVFQNCNILPQKPMLNQQNTITAQGKFDPNQNTGISIQNCSILPLAADFTGVQTFLGRPWKNYSTTIFMENFMENFIDPKGWLPWMGTTAPDTIFYAEYQNFGPGATNTSRVPWKGLKLNITSKQARKFLVKSFINGNKWLPATGARFNPGF
ncbi:hypothetical protein ACH5RR_036683 [Cinchona calisaya]|uniref:Pectinesterase n=1 Tax=Cinchona calisaya TaxID=153742 RepID=A0ABD2Y8F7_9GENT